MFLKNIALHLAMITILKEEGVNNKLRHLIQKTGVKQGFSLNNTISTALEACVNKNQHFKFKNMKQNNNIYR